MRYVSIHLFQDFGRILHEEYKRAQAQLEEQGTAEMGEMNLDAVSYTHLTLPTILLV